MNELILQVNQQIGLIGTNFEEINKALDSHLEKYQGLVISESEIKDAKEIRAYLNRLKCQIDDRRKQVKAEFCKPYDDFAEQVKVLTGKIEKCSREIDVQIKSFEDQAKKEKYNTIKEWWETECVTLPAVPFEKVYEQKFMNKTCREADWKKILTEKKETIEATLKSIAEFETTQKRDYILNEYLKELDIGRALSAWEAYSDQLRQAEEYRRRAAERLKVTNPTPEVIPFVSEPLKRVPEVSEAEHSTVVRSIPEEQAVILHRKLEVWATKEQIIAMGDFMIQNGIKFRKIEEKEND